MLRACCSKMANPLRRLLPDNASVPPICFKLALNAASNPLAQQKFSHTASNAQTHQQTAASQDSSKSETIEQNPFYSKYADKIANKSQASLQQNSQSFAQHLVEKPSSSIETKKTCSNCEPTCVQQSIKDDLIPSTNSQAAHCDINNSEDNSRFNPKGSTNKKSLDDLVKLDLLRGKSCDEIVGIWNAYHSKKDCIYATIPSDLYDTFYSNSKKYPSFIFPLPRNKDQEPGGYEFFLLQFEEHQCYFTPLAAYHLHKEMAPVCLTVHHYPELSQSKGIVLMMGEHDSNILNIMECQCLANQLQYYYTTKDAAAQLSLHLFNKETKSFDHMRLIRHLEEGILTNGVGAINLNKQD